MIATFFIQVIPAFMTTLRIRFDFLLVGNAIVTVGTADCGYNNNVTNNDYGRPQGTLYNTFARSAALSTPWSI